MRALLVVALFAPSIARAGDPIDVHPWARFPLGTRVVSTSGPAGNRSIFRYTLKARTATAYDIEYTIASKEIAAMAPKLEHHDVGELAPAASPDAQKLGEETVTVGGKALRCTSYRWSGRGGPNTTVEITECRAPGVGVPVKRVTKSSVYGMPVVETYVATRLDEPVRAAGRTWKTVRLEGTDLVDGKPIQVIRWESLGVPGGLVKSTRSDGGKVIGEAEVVQVSIPRARSHD